MSMTESDIQQSIRLALGRDRDVVLWRNSVGVGTTPDGRSQRFGLCPGSADLIGIGPGGRFLAIEVKTNHGRVAPDQARFVDLVRARGGIAGICRSVEDAVALVQAAREGRV